MKTTLAVYANADDALLVWSVDELDDHCGGFAIQRKRGRSRVPTWLDNYAPPGRKAHQRGLHQRSDTRPFRRFSWTDHEVGAGDAVRYRVVPVVSGKPVEALASEWSELRTALLALLAEVAAGDEHVYAALFELNDAVLQPALEAVGARAHVVLANGSITAAKGEGSARARTRDQNAAARKRLTDAGVDVRDRFISPGGLGHNKFLVVTSAAGEPRRVWTGSTNWSTTGLCTQLNNALLVDDRDVAQAYLAQWHALRDAGSEHPRTLSAGNRTVTTVDRTSVHFTRAQKRVDLTALGDIVRGAREGVLFLMFIPGGSGVVATVREIAAAKPDVLVRGVVSELPRGAADEQTGPTTKVRVTLFGDPTGPLPVPRTFDVVQPRGLRHVAAGWAVETTRDQFLGHVGHAIIHSKVLVVDPFSDDPTVVTGSHNFSISASEKNDENFIVVRGDRALAEAYAVNIESAWRHYAARIGAAHASLKGIGYLRALLADQRGEERFWRVGA